MPCLTFASLLLLRTYAGISAVFRRHVEAFLPLQTMRGGLLTGRNAMPVDAVRDVRCSPSCSSLRLPRKRLWLAKCDRFAIILRRTISEGYTPILEKVGRQTSPSAGPGCVFAINQGDCGSTTVSAGMPSMSGIVVQPSRHCDSIRPGCTAPRSAGRLNIPRSSQAKAVASRLSGFGRCCQQGPKGRVNRAGDRISVRASAIFKSAIVLRSFCAERLRRFRTIFSIIMSTLALTGMSTWMCVRNVWACSHSAQGL